MYESIKEALGIPDFVDTIVTILGFSFFGLLGVLFLKAYIDDVILKKCYHGVRRGYVDRKCDKCFTDEMKESQPSNKHNLGLCQSCGEIVPKRFMHVHIPQGQELKYDVNEVNEFTENRSIDPIFKEQMHLRYYPPIKYNLNHCDNCYIENQAKNFKNIYQFRDWDESIVAPFGLAFWVLFIGIFAGWIELSRDYLLIAMVYAALVLLNRYLLGINITTPKQQATLELDKAIEVHNQITRALDYINRMDEEEAAARERVRIRQTSRIDEIDKMTGVQFEQRLF